MIGPKISNQKDKKKNMSEWKQNDNHDLVRWRKE